MSQVIWRAEVTEEMVAHLNDNQRTKFINELNRDVDALGQVYKVGREFKDGKLKENSHV
jgi:hypothetical protein